MRRTTLPIVLSLGLIAVVASPASAADTRAEYIAQVDPICQASVGAVNSSWGAYGKNFKRLGRAAKSGRERAFLTLTKKTSVSLRRYLDIHGSLTDQIGAVPPPAADAATIATWLNDRRQSDAHYRSAAFALYALQFKKWFARLGQGYKAYAAGESAIAGFGFQVCGVGKI